MLRIKVACMNGKTAVYIIQIQDRALEKMLYRKKYCGTTC